MVSGCAISAYTTYPSISTGSEHATTRYATRTGRSSGRLRGTTTPSARVTRAPKYTA